MSELNLETFVDANGVERKLKLRFPRQSYERYRADSWDELRANDYKLLIDIIKRHKQYQRPRVQELLDYAQGRNHRILEGDNRRNETDMADERAVHNFGGLFSTFEQGFIASIPIQVIYSKLNLDGEELPEAVEVQKIFEKVGTKNNFKKLDRSVIRDASRMGRAYDITYHVGKDDEINETKVRKLSPLETFVIFDNSLSEHSIAGVRYYTVKKLEEETEHVEVWTRYGVYRFILNGDQLKENEELPYEDHGFRDVPITEYRRNEFGIGSYETVLTLIDIYDANQSDTANYMTDLADAILAVFGNVKFPDGMTSQQQLEWMKKMRKARLMLMKPPTDNDGKDSGQIDAKYLVKSYDVAGSEAQKKRIEKDIHKFANMPNLNDENFSGVQSGEAMKYKLFGLEQEVTDIQAEIETGLRRRYELIATIEKQNGSISEFDMANLNIKFTLNLPKSLQEMVETLKALGGVVSNRTAIELSGLDIDPEEEESLMSNQAGGEKQGYDFNGGKDMYKIMAIQGRFKKGTISESVALKLLENLSVPEDEARSYLELPPKVLEVELEADMNGELA